MINTSIMAETTWKSSVTAAQPSLSPKRTQNVDTVNLRRIFGKVGPDSSDGKRLATGWKVRASNPGEGEIFRTCRERPWGPSSLLYNGYRVFPGGRKRPGRTLTPRLLLVPRSKEQSSTIPFLCLRAFVACKKGETYPVRS
jgi:hypothetical protein